MNRIPKCTSKYIIHQPNNIKPSQKESNKENLAQKISKRTLKFSANRQFGKDITNNNKPNLNSIYNNHSTKIITVIDKKQNLNNIYIKKHSSLSQVAEKSQKIKSSSGERKLREIKSNSIINKKNNDIIKKENTIQTNQPNHKLYSSISFGMNVNNINNRPISSNNNSISVRLSNPKNGAYTNKYYGNINNRSINNIHNNNINHHNYNYNYSSIMNNNIKNENLNHVHTHTTLDLM